MPSGWTRKRGSTWTWYIEDVRTRAPAGPARFPRAAFGPGRKPETPSWRRRQPCDPGRSWNRPSERSAATS
jgi:hypothetical protein